jgi:hypothetical protein
VVRSILTKPPLAGLLSSGRERSSKPRFVSFRASLSEGDGRACPESSKGRNRRDAMSFSDNRSALIPRRLAVVGCASLGMTMGGRDLSTLIGGAHVGFAAIFSAFASITIQKSS